MIRRVGDHRDPRGVQRQHRGKPIARKARNRRQVRTARKQMAQRPVHRPIRPRKILRQIIDQRVVDHGQRPARRDRPRVAQVEQGRAARRARQRQLLPGMATKTTDILRLKMRPLWRCSNARRQEQCPSRRLRTAFNTVVNLVEQHPGKSLHAGHRASQKPAVNSNHCLCFPILSVDRHGATPEACRTATKWHDPSLMLIPSISFSYKILLSGYGDAIARRWGNRYHCCIAAKTGRLTSGRFSRDLGTRWK